MAVFKGKDANVIWEGDAGGKITLAHIQSWTASAIHDVAEITSMQDTWTTFIGGFIDWTATVECLLDTGGSTVPLIDTDDIEAEALGEDTPVALDLYLLHSTGDYNAVYGNAICNGISVSQEKDDVTKITYSFQGTGVFAYWDDITEVVH